MKISHYNVTSVIGQGGMATVYLAKDEKFQADVAIKVLSKEFIHNENIRKRFLAEARNMFRMNHPNVVRVTDLIDDGDSVAFVMEHVEGKTLKDYISSKGPLSDSDIRNLFTQMLKAVGYVHEQGFVHRDIKPSNFIIDKKGKVKLLDFGIAKNTDAASSEYTMTGTAQQMGTPMYMSPEQIRSTKEVTSASDIYSLGVVLWQMVTGGNPYDIKTLSSFDLQLKIVQEELSVTGTSWDAFIKKACQKNPVERADIRSLLTIMTGNNSKLGDDFTIVDTVKKKSEEGKERTVVESKKDEIQVQKPVAVSLKSLKIITWLQMVLILLLLIFFVFSLKEYNEAYSRHWDYILSDTEGNTDYYWYYKRNEISTGVGVASAVIIGISLLFLLIRFKSYKSIKQPAFIRGFRIVSFVVMGCLSFMLVVAEGDVKIPNVQIAWYLFILSEIVFNVNTLSHIKSTQSKNLN